MPRSLLLSALLAVVALTGCAGRPASGDSSSSTRFNGQERLVANTVEDLESAARPGRTDTGKICRDLLAPALARRFAAGGRTCEKGVDAALKDADAYQLTVQDVAIRGTDATARVEVETGDKDRVQTISLVKAPAEGWRISRFG